jgi:Family of unknown function (DUF6188)
MSGLELIETTDRWMLPLGGCEVVQCRVDFAFTVLAEGPAGAFEVRVEQPFEWIAGADAAGPISIDVASHPTAAAPALACRGKSILEATAFKDGRLELSFGDGLALRVPPGKDFEPWTVAGPDGLRVVSAPGGKLSIWSPGDPELDA